MNNSHLSLEERVSILEDLLLEEDEKERTDVIVKVGNKWKILKNNLKDYWDETYDTKEDAEKALATYLKYVKSILNKY